MKRSGEVRGRERGVSHAPGPPIWFQVATACRDRAQGGRLSRIAPLFIFVFAGALLVPPVEAGPLDGVRGDAAKGREVYQVYCAACHGPGGKGDGPQAQHLDHPLKNFADPQYQESLADVYIKRVIMECGVALHECETMPSWASVLSPEDVANVIAYIRSLRRE